ncbi:hypothetical protein D3C80_1022430 [compost metagenome]
MLAAAGAVGVADDFNGVLVELLQRAGQVVQWRVEVWRDIRRIGGEGDIARHDQLDLVAFTLHFHAGVGHARPQCGFLLVGVVAVACRRGTGDSSADQRALATVVVVDRSTGHGTGQGSQAAVLGGFAHPGGALLRLALFVVRGLCTTGQQGNGGSNNNQATRGEHGKAPTYTFKCAAKPAADF